MDKRTTMRVRSPKIPHQRTTQTIAEGEEKGKQNFQQDSEKIQFLLPFPVFEHRRVEGSTEMGVGA